MNFVQIDMTDKLFLSDKSSITNSKVTHVILILVVMLVLVIVFDKGLT